MQIAHYNGRDLEHDATQFPHRVRVVLRPPEFMQVAFVAMSPTGSEVVEFVCESREAADDILTNGHPDMNGGRPITDHARFQRFEHLS